MPEGAGSDFPPRRAAAKSRLEAVRPADYARTRNHLQGAVTRLSPYITHGLLTLPEVYRAVDGRHSIGAQHTFTFELGWREFFHHQWHQHGRSIFDSLRAGPLPDAAYSRAMPEDLLSAQTGIPVIDQAVTQLYLGGWLHNHARMWLASYLVHLRRVHWRVGADWMYGHLLDGDLASNHLSWQWVAATASHKPYLFNADNVARYAPSPWHSAGTVLDTDYDTLEAIARGGALPVASGWSVQRAGMGEPRVAPPVACEPPPGRSAGPPIVTAQPSDLAGRWLVHPWNIRPAPSGRSPIGVLFAPFHRRWPWSERRWRFVLGAMSEVCERIVWCESLDGEALAASGCRTTAEPHLADWLPSACCEPAPRLFEWPQRACRSFSDFWNRTRLAST